MNLKDIHTVVCHSLAGDEDSTVSFEDFDDAINYILTEEMAERDATDDEMMNAARELSDQGYTTYGDWEYTIYDAKLVLKKN